MGYGGKGGKNPVSELTTFYKPVKHNPYSLDQEEGAGQPEEGGYIVGIAPPGMFAYALWHIRTVVIEGVCMCVCMCM